MNESMVLYYLYMTLQALLRSRTKDEIDKVVKDVMSEPEMSANEYVLGVIKWATAIRRKEVSDGSDSMGPE